MAGDISVIIVVVATVFALLLLRALLRLGVALMRWGCLIVVIVLFVYVLTRSFG